MNYIVNLSALISLFLSINLFAMDVVTMHAQKAESAKKEMHKYQVIKRALKLTLEEYGPYQLKVITIPLVKSRALKLIDEGDVFNSIILIANPDWNRNAIPIKIPLRLGINSYRLLLVNKNNLAKFEQVYTINDLKNLTVGLGRDWTITNTFNELNFNTVESSDFESTFLMLKKQRFDYIPRGMNEIFVELEMRKPLLNDLIVEPNLALELKLATYIYVSKKHPRVAERLEVGLRKMSKNGDLKAIFNEYYLEDIQRADLHNRRIIKIDNPLFVDKELLDDKSLWLSPTEIPNLTYSMY